MSGLIASGGRIKKILIQFTCVIFTQLVIPAQQTYLLEVFTQFHKYCCSSLCKRLVRDLLHFDCEQSSLLQWCNTQYGPHTIPMLTLFDSISQIPTMDFLNKFDFFNYLMIDHVLCIFETFMANVTSCRFIYFFSL